MGFLGLLRLLRPGNAALAGTGAAVGALLAVAPAGPWPGSLPLAAAAAALVAAFGNVLNDLADARLDERAHPRRPLPSGRVTSRQATTLLLACAAGGLAAAWLAGGPPAFAFAAGNVLLLVLYERVLKPLGLPGNALVALLVASVFPFGALAATGPPGWPFQPAVWGLAAFAFLANLGRELLKDAEDRDADLGHRRTFAVRHGARAAATLALALVLAAVAAALAASLGLAPGGPAVTPGRILLALSCLALGVGAVRGLANPGQGQRLLKLGMAAALAAYAAGPLAALVAR